MVEICSEPRPGSAAASVTDLFWQRLAGSPDGEIGDRDKARRRLAHCGNNIDACMAVATLTDWTCWTGASSRAREHRV